MDAVINEANLPCLPYPVSKIVMVLPWFRLLFYASELPIADAISTSWR